MNVLWHGRWLLSFSKSPEVYALTCYIRVKRRSLETNVFALHAVPNFITNVVKGLFIITACKVVEHSSQLLVVLSKILRDLCITQLSKQLFTVQQLSQ